MKALNVPIHDMIACLPPIPDRCYWDGIHADVVLGVVTKCERCHGSGIVAAYYGDAIDCVKCDGTGYAPPKFVKVLAVWPIYDYDALMDHGLITDWMPHVTIDAFGNVLVCRRDEKYHDEWSEINVVLPDAVPGGVALHVEWTDCPDCGSKGVRLDPDTVALAFFAVMDYGPGAGAPILRCSTCQTPFVPPSDAPIVEVK